MKKRIAFMSTGCQNSFGRPREIIASIPELTEVSKSENPDYIMANFCAISTENIDAFTAMKSEIMRMKQKNPNLKVLAGGCIEGLSIKKDLSFADGIFHHQEEATAFLRFLGYDSMPDSRPATIFDTAFIVIAQGCNRRCTFCKVHYLNHMQLTSRPVAEIIALVHAAVAQGIHNIHLSAENATEYGADIGTNICNLLQIIVAIDGVRYIDISGLCAEEINPKLLKLLQNPKTRQLQIETQSLHDPIRKAMGLNKTTNEILAIHDALRGKFITSLLMAGFHNCHPKEFEKELKLIRRHHLYYLTYTPYDDTEGTPSHRFYQKPSDDEFFYYQSAFSATIAAERQLILEQLKAQDYIEASIIEITEDSYVMIPANYTVKITARNRNNHHKVGDIVRVKITKLHRLMDDHQQEQFLANTGHANGSASDAKFAELLRNTQYFGDHDQIMKVRGIILNE